MAFNPLTDGQFEHKLASMLSRLSSLKEDLEALVAYVDFETSDSNEGPTVQDIGYLLDVEEVLRPVLEATGSDLVTYQGEIEPNDE